MIDPLTVLIAGIICAALALGAWKGHILDSRGAITAFLIGFATFVFPADGWKWFLVLLVFLMVSSYMTHYKYQIKRKKGFAQEKGGARGWPNVAANGVVAGLLVLFTPFLPQEQIQLVLAAFLGAVATANADTLATEIGLLNPTDPRLVTDLKKVVPAGTSGGISIFGELATLFGALLIGIAAGLLGMAGNPGWSLSVLIGTTMIAGLAGCSIDSVIGATVQGIYKCRVCNKITENRRHCGNPSIPLRGHKVIDNNVVNLIATICGAAVAVLFLVLS
ncbi:MAG: DUF92 domain-containing protein [Candidatus Bathyarchaeia archaeon]